MPCNRAIEAREATASGNCGSRGTTGAEGATALTAALGNRGLRLLDTAQRRAAAEARALALAALRHRRSGFCGNELTPLRIRRARGAWRR